MTCKVTRLVDTQGQHFPPLHLRDTLIKFPSTKNLESFDKKEIPALDFQLCQDIEMEKKKFLTLTKSLEVIG